ncbi:MAG TPA: ribosome biogenesis GTPase Der [Gammaproteobacteria bacterium]|nr:ribosome biogenesis GTPase Der [Gammaproteobacteria bacterium]
MLPVIALIGRPNVGKSTLFNYLTRSRDALVADYPGLTRDRQYGFGRIGARPYVVIDTGGIGIGDQGVAAAMRRQTMLALEEADCVLLLVDARSRVTAADEEIAAAVRRGGKPVRLVVNKAEGLDEGMTAAEYFGLGMGRPWLISAAHGQGVAPLMGDVLDAVPPDATQEPGDEDDRRVRMAVVGRPNVGKSTLVNRILGEERVVTFEVAGTTRDAVEIPFERDGRAWTLIDTAGIRRRARVRETIEKFSVIKTLQAIERAHVVLLLVDAREGVSEQDASIAGLALDRGRGMVLAVNKWDGLPPEQREAVRRQLDVKLAFLDFVPVHYISALHGSGVGELFGAVAAVHAAATRELPTPRLTRVLEDAVAAHQPPLVRGRRIKLRYAHQGGRNPPLIVIHGNQTSRVPAAYRRYLANAFRKAFELAGTPVRIEFRTGENPYAGRTSGKPTRRQMVRRRRVIRHDRGKS